MGSESCLGAVYGLAEAGAFGIVPLPGALKIGMVESNTSTGAEMAVRARRNACQTGNPRKLVVAGIFYVPREMYSPRQLEATLHRHFAERQIEDGGTEWFNVGWTEVETTADALVQAKIKIQLGIMS